MYGAFGAKATRPPEKRIGGKFAADTVLFLLRKCPEAIDAGGGAGLSRSVF